LSGGAETVTKPDPGAGSEWLDVVMEEVRRKREEAAEQRPVPPPAAEPEGEPPESGGDR
jgi:hypothetical protein